MTNLDINVVTTVFVTLGRGVLVSLLLGTLLAPPVITLVRRVRRSHPPLAHGVALAALAALAIVPALIGALPTIVTGPQTSHPAAFSLPAAVLPPAITAATGTVASDAAAAVQNLRTAARPLLKPFPTGATAWALLFTGLAWTFGTGLALTRLLRSWRASLPRTTLGVQAPETVRAVAREVAASAGLKRPPALIMSDRATSPMLTGVLHPTLILPAEATTWDPQMTRIMVSHELAHARRGDVTWGLLESALLALLFFHPLARWLASAADGSREDATDDDAMALAAVSPRDYVASLARLARSRHARLTMAANAGSLLRRSQRLLARQPQRRSPAWLQALLAGLAVPIPSGATAVLAQATTPPGLPRTLVWATVTRGIAYTSDFTGIRNLSPTQQVRITELADGTGRTIRVQSTPSGAGLRYTYTVAGHPQPFTASARAWYHQMLETAVLQPMRQHYTTTPTAGMSDATSHTIGDTYYSLLQVDPATKEVNPLSITVLAPWARWTDEAPDAPGRYPPLGEQTTVQGLLQVQHGLAVGALAQEPAFETLQRAIAANPTSSEAVQVALVHPITAFQQPEHALALMNDMLDADHPDAAVRHLLRRIALETIPDTPARAKLLARLGGA